MNASPKRVLVVEDQRLVAADLEDTLKRLGYDVVGNVASGEAAIPRAIEARPDLALMDIRLRGEMDGIQAATVIVRSQPATGRINRPRNDARPNRSPCGPWDSGLVRSGPPARW